MSDRLPSTVGPAPRATPAMHRLGVVSFLNARPLVDALMGRTDCLVRAAVPSKLASMLAEGDCDVALLPVVDFYRDRHRLTQVSDACIASDGETMTVRVFSRVPPDKLTRLAADTDSHTSVVLAQVVWRQMYGCALTVTPYRAEDGHLGAGDVEGLLLIGDKVICDVPRGFGFEVDLGAAWKHLTGLPFVFAAWFGPKERDLEPVARLLEHARDRGLADAGRIAVEGAAAHGWPEKTAVKYLCDAMRYRLTQPMRAAMERFFALAEGYGLLP